MENYKDKYINLIDRFIKPLVWYSVIMTVLEISPTLNVGGVHSSGGFLWSERFVALVFTIEFVLRLLRSGPGKYVYMEGWRPRFSPFAVIDIIAIAPFWVGFCVPVGALRFIRVARILRLLKFYRYSRSLQLNALGFYRAFNQLKGLFFQIFITYVIFTLFVYEAEHIAQPEAFSNLFKTCWFSIVSLTTVGFGDRFPVTEIGMTFVGLSLTFIIAQAASAIGILNSTFDQVMDEEKNPNIDPIKLFEVEIANRIKIKEMDHNYKMKEE